MVDLLVTYLEMKAPPDELDLSTLKNGVMIEREIIDPTAYLDLYRAVGEPSQWDQRLRMSISGLHRFLIDPTTHLYILRLDGQAVGPCEFGGVGKPGVELTHFGLIAEFQGQKLGPYLLDRALRAIWSQAPRRIWLHTDTDDHPKALPIYQRAGFQIYDQRIETFPD